MRDSIIRQCAIRGIILSRAIGQSEDLRLWYAPPTSNANARLILTRASAEPSLYGLSYEPVEGGLLPALTYFSEYQDWVSSKVQSLPLTKIERTALVLDSRGWHVKWEVLDAGIQDVITVLVSTRWAKAKEPYAWIKRETVNVTRKQLRELGNFFLDRASKT